MFLLFTIFIFDDNGNIVRESLFFELVVHILIFFVDELFRLKIGMDILNSKAMRFRMRMAEFLSTWVLSSG